MLPIFFARNRYIRLIPLKQICEPILKNYNEHITDVVRWCTEKVNKREYKESMICWPLADNLRLQTPVLTKLVGGTSIVKEFNDNVHRIGGRILEEFLNSVKNDPDKESSMPPDGTVHALTSRAMLIVLLHRVFNNSALYFLR